MKSIGQKVVLTMVVMALEQEDECQAFTDLFTEM